LKRWTVSEDNRDALLHSSSDTSDEEEDSYRGRRDGDERRERYSDRGQRRRQARERSDSLGAGAKEDENNRRIHHRVGQGDMISRLSRTMGARVRKS